MILKTLCEISPKARYGCNNIKHIKRILQSISLFLSFVLFFFQVNQETPSQTICRKWGKRKIRIIFSPTSDDDVDGYYCEFSLWGWRNLQLNGLGFCITFSLLFFAITSRIFLCCLYYTSIKWLRWHMEIKLHLL